MVWTEDHLPDQQGQVALITGANSGIGFETARALADHGATVIMACRNERRATNAARNIREAVQGADLRIENCDLASLSSIEACANRVQNDGISIDVLINNAGIMGVPYRETADGFESQFGINHLGHFALTGQLFSTLSDTSRVVTVSSEMHRRASLSFADLQLKESYRRWRAYANSKLANILFAYELDRRCATAGLNLHSLAAHPGYADTALQRRSAGNSTIRRYFMRIANGLFAQPAAAGALPVLYAAAAPDVDGQSYYGPDGFLNMRGYPTTVEPAAVAQDEQIAQRLWDRSRELTGVSYPIPATPLP